MDEGAGLCRIRVSVPYRRPVVAVDRPHPALAKQYLAAIPLLARVRRMLAHRRTGIADPSSSYPRVGAQRPRRVDERGAEPAGFAFASKKRGYRGSIPPEQRAQGA